MSTRPEPYATLIAEFSAAADKLGSLNLPVAKNMARSLRFTASMLQSAWVK
ncbi:MAG: hypothetical protein IRZ33_05970 [Alicyclobacillaceae bacterium]|nr:hypothetical protein [Alicyclobacillaceae bacterium]